jgi:hypothetical protein
LHSLIFHSCAPFYTNPKSRKQIAANEIAPAKMPLPRDFYFAEQRQL